MAAKFAALREQLKEGRVLLPGDEGFDDSLKRWSVTCVKPAAAVAQPKTAAEASAVVRFATAHGIAFNVKSGGHSTAPVSCAPSPEGMVLDLALMRAVSVDAAARTVSFGGGCTWSDVDDALWPHGLATPGGTVSHTGVGGLVLHGGFGVLSGLHGLTIDILTACEVVLADGRVVTASEDQHPDLFWALRGAGSSFGVVTSFTSRAFPQGDVWGGMLMFAPHKLPAIVDFLNTWAATNDGRQGMMVVFAHGPPGPEGGARPPLVATQMFHMGPDADAAGPAFFAPLLAMRPEALAAQVGAMPYPAVNRATDESLFAWGRRYQFGGSNFRAPLALATAEAIRDKFWGFAAAHPGAGLEASACMLECLPNSKIREVAPGATAYNNRGDYYNVGIVWSWEDAALDGAVRDYNRGFQEETRRLGGDEAGRYLNYDGTNTLTADTAFGANAARLREVKAQYDPANVFDKLSKLVGKVEEQWVQ